MVELAIKLVYTSKQTRGSIKLLFYLFRQKKQIKLIIMKKIVLENSRNPHEIDSPKELEIIKKIDTTILIKTNDVSYVRHGQHAIININSPYILKCVQKEVNPLTKKIEDAND